MEQAPLKVMFRGRIVGEFYPDLVIEDRLIVDLKAVKSLSSEHEAQLINYLKVTGVKVDVLVRSRNQSYSVIPVQTGIQSIQAYS